MRTCTTRKKDGRRYFYYACAKHYKERDTCPNRRSYRAQALETAVQRVISDLLANPSEVREAFEAALQRERDGEHGDLDQEAQAWLEKLEEAEHMRRGYQEIAAKGLMTLDELSARLDRLENGRATALRELDTIEDDGSAKRSWSAAGMPSSGPTLAWRQGSWEAWSQSNATDSTGRYG